MTHHPCSSTKCPYTDQVRSITSEFQEGEYPITISDFSHNEKTYTEVKLAQPFQVAIRCQSHPGSFDALKTERLLTKPGH